MNENAGIVPPEPSHNNEIILYQPDSTVKIEVRLENETVWLNRQQIATLFDRDVKTIGKHIANALKEELEGFSTVANFATVQIEGNRTVTRRIEYYNLDVIISVGYRVKSKRGVQFRAWANKVLREYLMKGYAVSQRFERLEYRMAKTEEKINFIINTSLPPREGVFFEGQIFDAYTLMCDLVRSARRRIIMIDNYIDDSVFRQLDKRAAGVSATIFTPTVSRTLRQDLERHNSQYTPIEIRTYSKAHDRFLIIDDTVYHVGASFKDLGKKLFAFSRMEAMTADEMLVHLCN